MRKLLLSRMMLLLCALVAGSGSVWAENVTFAYDDYKGYGTTSTGSEYTMVKTDVSIKNTKFYGNNNYAHFYASGTTTITPSTGVTITGIVLTASATNYNGFQSNGTITASTGSVSGSTSSTTVTWSGSATSAFTITNSKQIRWTSIVVTYSKAVVEKTDPTITFSNGSVRVGKTIDLSTLFTSNSTGAVTYSITSGNSYASLSGSTLTGIAEGSVTVKAEQAASGSYNAGEATATITVNAALVLSNIEIVSEPTKTTYNEGETFDATGMEVYATYTNDDIDDVTASCTWTPTGALTTSDTEITVSYTENGVTKTATQAITVNEVVDYATLPFNWAGGSSADLKKEIGVSTSSLDSDYADSHSPYLVKFNGTGKYITIKTDSQPGQVTVGIKKVGGANTSTLTIQESADGETFTDVEDLYTEGKTNAEVSLSTTKLFKESSRYVRIYFTKAYNEATGSNIGVGPISITKTATITLSSACTDGTKYYGTYSNGSAFVVPSDLTVSTIGVSGGKLTVSDYKTGDVVKANTGVMVSSATSGSHTVTLTAATGTELDGNMLKASGDAGIEADDMDEVYTKFYRLTMHDGTRIGFWWGATDGAAFDLAANKAYLAVSTNTSRQGFSLFGDDASGIGATLVNREEKIVNVYDLQGRRVESSIFNSQSSILKKGLYIVNGKKIVIK